MNGPGTYTFPDGSTIQADWIENKPFTNIVYREPLGFAWIVENMSENVKELNRVLERIFYGKQELTFKL